MEEVMTELRKIQNEIAEQKTTILQSGEKVTEQVTQNINVMLEEKFKALEEKHEKLKEKVENQEKRLYYLEKCARQRNVVFFGIEEKETSYLNLERNMIEFIKKYFSIELERGSIQEVRRLGRKGERPRPITVAFSTLGIKIDIFKQKTALNETAYYMKEDYPHYVLEKRKELQEQVKIEREKGNLAIIKYDKIIILDKNTNTTNNNKRMLSISPENNLPAQTRKETQTNKKNKTGAPYKRSSSLSEGVLKPGMLSFLTTNNPNNVFKQQDKKNANA